MYAVKVIIWSKPTVSAAVGYVAVDLYGKVNEVKANQPAVEKNALPGTQSLLIVLFSRCDY